VDRGHGAGPDGGRDVDVHLRDTDRLGVGFYLAHSAVVADTVHPVLFEHEPDDIHLVSPVG